MIQIIRGPRYEEDLLDAYKRKRDATEQMHNMPVPTEMQREEGHGTNNTKDTDVLQLHDADVQVPVRYRGREPDFIVFDDYYNTTTFGPIEDGEVRSVHDADDV